MKKIGFTLAEVLITLAIIGVVAAISIPSVVANTQQKEFQTGLRKAVSVLNSAITMNMAIDGESPYENKDLFEYLQRHMSVIETNQVTTYSHNGYAGNKVFYTTDGMRFEFWHWPEIANNDAAIASATSGKIMPLYENNDIRPKLITAPSGKCGSYGLNSNSDETKSPPCLITVDVNGDRKPNPKSVRCFRNKDYAEGGCTISELNVYKLSDPNGIKLTDIFSVMITDKQAIPYGTAAQRAMYQAQKGK